MTIVASKTAVEELAERVRHYFEISGIRSSDPNTQISLATDSVKITRWLSGAWITQRFPLHVTISGTSDFIATATFLGVTVTHQTSEPNWSEAYEGAMRELEQEITNLTRQI